MKAFLKYSLFCSFFFCSLSMFGQANNNSIGFGGTSEEILDTIVPLFDVSSLSRYRAKLAAAKLDSSALVAMLFGNSNSTNEQPIAGDTSGTGFTGLLKQYFWSIGEYMGTGWQGAALQGNPLGCWLAKTGTHVNLRSNTIPVGGDLIHTASKLELGATISFNVLPWQMGSTCRLFDAYYEKGSGDFQYTIVGSSSPVFVENSTGSGVGKLEYDHGSIAAFSVLFEALEDDFIIYGANRWIDTSGVLIHKAALSGYGYSLAEELSKLESFEYIVTDLSPDLCITNLGSNYTGIPSFIGFDTSPEGYAISMDTFCTKLQVLTNCDILVLLHADPISPPSSTIPVISYTRAGYQKAKEKGWSHGSLYHYHSNGQENLALGVTIDPVHYSAGIGSRLNFEFLREILWLW